MNNDSSNTWAKAGVFLVVAAIVLVGGWYAWNMKTTADTANALAAREAAVPKSSRSQKVGYKSQLRLEIPARIHQMLRLIEIVQQSTRR